MAESKITKNGSICQVDNCNEPAIGKGYCNRHYIQIRKYGVIQKDKPVYESICKVYKCNNPHKAHGYCNKHWHQVKLYGQIKERTKWDPNEFIFDGDMCRIQLYDKDSIRIAEAIIDISDYDLVKDRKWFLKKGDSGVYAASGGSKHPFISLSRLIMNAEKGKEVDHEDHDTLNDRRYNLRVCTKAQNQHNSLFRKDNTSGAKGVYFCNTTKRWKVTINKNNMVHRIGAFKTFAEAEAAANEARRDLHGDYAHNG